MTYETKNFEKLLGTPGFSDALLRNHFTLYKGYVTQTNQLATTLATLAQEGRVATPEFAELKRRFGWEWNGMRLHELYFGNLTKSAKPLDPRSTVAAQIATDFGTVARWESEFKATGAMRGIGWVILAHDRAGARLFNTWVDEHADGHLAGAQPLLVMDVFEHAFMLDYGLKRAEYIEAFFHSIHWDEVGARF